MQAYTRLPLSTSSLDEDANRDVNYTIQHFDEQLQQPEKWLDVTLEDQKAEIKKLVVKVKENRRVAEEAWQAAIKKDFMHETRMQAK